jgi:hypothetical protein
MDGMAIDFTVIQSVRQRFGDSEPDQEFPLEEEAPFVGVQKEFPALPQNVYGPRLDAGLR